jgi:hypothetical protein
VAGIRRHAKAHWQGTGKDGTGTLTTQSGTLKATPYGFTSRFGDGQGTNPEELIAAAHASVPHDEKFLPPPVGQVLCGMRIGTGH